MGREAIRHVRAPNAVEFDGCDALQSGPRNARAVAAILLVTERMTA
jgi:hypothetical protein